MQKYLTRAGAFDSLEQQDPLQSAPLLAGICFLLAFFLYFPSVTYGFLWDDTQFILQNSYLRNPLHLWEVFREFFTTSDEPVRIAGSARPAWVATLVWDHWLWGLNPFGFHLTNVLLHAMNSAFAFLVALRITRSRRAGFLAGAAFAVHPVHAESVAAIGFRTDMLCLFFVFASCLAFWRAFPPEGPEPSEPLNSRRRIVLYTVSLVCYLFALLSKEMAAPLPAVLLAGDMVRRGTSLRRILLYVPFLLILVFYGHQHRTRFSYKLSDAATSASLPRPSFGTLAWAAETTDVSGKTNENRSGQGALEQDVPSVKPSAREQEISRVYRDPVVNAATMVPVFARYIGKMILPVSYCADYDVPVRSSLGSGVVLFSAIVLFSGLVVIVLLMRAHPDIAWGLLWFGLFITPVSNVIPLANLMADRYLYVPSFGFLIALFGGFEILLRKVQLQKRAVAAILAVLFLAWGGKSLLHSHVWRDDLSLFTEIVECSPRNFRGWYNLGLTYQRRGLWQKAVANYRQAAERGPHRKEIYVNMGHCYAEAGDPAAALNAYQEALRRDPEDKLALTNIGLLFYRQKNYPQAVDYLVRALQASDRDSGIAVHLADTYFASGDFLRASNYYRLAVEWNPRLALAHFRLGLSFLRQGKKEMARDIWERHLALYPNDREGKAAIERELKRS